MTTAPAKTETVPLAQTRLGQMLGKKLPEIPERILVPELTGLEPGSPEHKTATDAYDAAAKTRARHMQKRNLIIQFHEPLALIANRTGLFMTRTASAETTLGLMLGGTGPSDVSDSDTVAELQNALAYLNFVQTAVNLSAEDQTRYSAAIAETANRDAIGRCREYAELFGGDIGAMRKTLDRVIGPMIGIESFALPRPIVHPPKGEYGVIALKRQRVIDFAVNTRWDKAFAAVQDAVLQTAEAHVVASL